jgi:hypothetical protein
MKRTFNYTGRRRIDRKDVSITLREDKGKWLFDADLKLASYRFPHNAEVWLEAHRQNLWMQFPWGTISNLRPVPNRNLDEFDVPDGVLFRVRVVQPPGQEHHKLLGEADGIPFVKLGDSDDHRRPLLVPCPDDLGQLLWRVDFESDPPRLLVNKDAQPTWKELARSPHFISLVYPEVLRSFLARILIEIKWSDDDKSDDWQTAWMLFAKGLGVQWPPPAPDDREDCEQWIEEAVSAFARHHRFKSMLDLTSEEKP